MENQNEIVELKVEELKVEEVKTPEFQTHKMCPLCNKIQKFKIVIHKTKGQILSGRKCISCTSKKNNEKLKARGYYASYYIDHATELKASDKLRYAQKKANQNIVSFTI